MRAGAANAGAGGSNCTTKKSAGKRTQHVKAFPCVFCCGSSAFGLLPFCEASMGSEKFRRRSLRHACVISALLSTHRLAGAPYPLSCNAAQMLLQLCDAVPKSARRSHFIALSHWRQCLSRAACSTLLFSSQPAARTCNLHGVHLSHRTDAAAPPSPSHRFMPHALTKSPRIPPSLPRKRRVRSADAGALVG